MRVIFIRRYFAALLAVAVGLCLAVGVPVMQTTRISSETRDYWSGSSDIIWQVNTRDRMIAITFDDGPSPTFTPQILDILKENEVKATFFVIAREAEKYPEIMRRISREGHEIANHTYNHKYLKRASDAQLAEELDKAESVIAGFTGQRPALFRPPGGYYNERIVRAAKERGYTVVIWSWEQQSLDWANPGVSRIVNKVLKNAASGNIIVFHDRGGNRTQTVKALKPIINGLRKDGYKLVTVSEMLSNVPGAD